MVDLPMDFLTRTWADITSGRHAPLAFRFILQPAVAAFLAYRAGRRDALDGRPLYFLALVRDRAQRRALIREGWGHVSKVFIVAVVMDAIYQFVAMRWVYPGEALMVALVLAVVPYLLFRSLVNWMLRRTRSR
ncbi:hypothetical protein [Variovorax ginsengisoli]|jgi:hypothetical protein|uniref:Rod shape-determining protein MreD n=1 Tax=Variovorax ginsengisoli TaxID=363844 RepID=A0ABT8S4V7_9BURK|nr:hypothetical protein [Variovorax ginsengisoli]MDN8614353.1 hypothetical protein [Variovorax ginsengisoli]MDO1533523.1 hypothetical protein [Variovorax ginsengisoli]